MVEYLGLLIIGIIIGFVIFWFKNRNNQSASGDLVKLKENLLNQLKSEYPEEYNHLIGNESVYELKDKINNLSKKKIEEELNEAKINLAAEKAEKDQLIKNNEFIKNQIETKEKTIKELTKGLESSTEIKKLHTEAMQEVRNERNENDKIVIKQENFLEKLTGNYQFQGHFNEDILKNILNGAQLEEGRDFIFNKKQITSDIEKEDKNVIPDCILNMIERSYVVDAKVSLVAWKKYVEEKDEKIKEQYLKEHIDSVRGHLYDKKKGLINKDYIKIYGLKSFQKVIVFFPSDNLLGFTMDQDKGLFTEALEDNFILAGPRTLMSMIKVFEQIKSEKKQIEGMKKIQDSATNIYDKYVGLKESIKLTFSTYRTHGKRLKDVVTKAWGQQGMEKEIKKLKDKHGVISSERIKEVNPEETEIFNVSDPEEDVTIINLNNDKK